MKVDFVSDVVCPWCVIGLLQLEAAFREVGIEPDITFHPFELNPWMPPEGQELGEHMAMKYGTTEEQSEQARDRLSSIGEDLGFTFNFEPGARIRNTFAAHQLLAWAKAKGLQGELKRAFFDAYFAQGKDISDTGVLVSTAESVGLSTEEARGVLESASYADQIRAEEEAWQAQGVMAVPFVRLGGVVAVSGAQGAERFAALIRKAAAKLEAGAAASSPAN